MTTGCTVLRPPLRAVIHRHLPRLVEESKSKREIFIVANRLNGSAALLSRFGRIRADDSWGDHTPFFDRCDVRINRRTGRDHRQFEGNGHLSSHLSGVVRRWEWVIERS